MTLPAHGLRHPLIFYYGHPATLYVNKLRAAGIIHVREALTEQQWYIYRY